MKRREGRGGRGKRKEDKPIGHDVSLEAEAILEVHLQCVVVAARPVADAALLTVLADLVVAARTRALVRLDGWRAAVYVL